MEYKKHFVYLLAVTQIHSFSTRAIYSSQSLVYGSYFYFLIEIYDRLTYFFYFYLQTSSFFGSPIHFFFSVC